MKDDRLTTLEGFGGDGVADVRLSDTGRPAEKQIVATPNGATIH